MNKIHQTNYKLYNQNISSDIRMVNLSDLHFSYEIGNEKLLKLLKYLMKLNPNYILIIGDIIDSLNMVDDLSERKRLLLWLEELGQVSEVLISLGSHDFCRKGVDDLANAESLMREKDELFHEIDFLKGVHVLDNKTYQDDEVFVLGYTQSIQYYFPHRKESLTDYVREDKNQMIRELKELKNMIGTIPEDKLKILMAHSPINLINDDVKSELQDFNFFVSGHMHNGCVPPILYELWNSDRGLIAPNKELFPKTERNTLKTIDDKLIVNGPITTFQECTGKLQLLNILFPSYISVLDFTDDVNFKTKKVHIQKSYNKY